jgi:hypothetical protein
VAYAENRLRHHQARFGGGVRRVEDEASERDQAGARRAGLDVTDQNGVVNDV